MKEPAKIARCLDDFDTTLDNAALNEENYDDYYVETKEGRGEDPTSKLIRRFKKSKDQNLKILLSGFKGCGKSTELLRLKRELDKDYLIKIFSVREKLDANNVSISEIIITVMKDLCEFVAENYTDIKLDKKLEKNLENWTSSIYEEEIKHRYYNAALGAGLEARTGFLKVLNVFGKLSLDFNAGRRFQEITRKEVNQTLSELILNCNLLVNDIKGQLKKIKKQNIIFLIEDLEKVERSVAEGIFYDYPKQLTAIDCSFIYTFPISLVYHPKHTIILNEFGGGKVALPMIKVHEKNGDDYVEGIDTITEIVYRRIDKEKNLVPEGLLRDFIRKSGGSLRDLFRMLRIAAENGIDRGVESIEEQDYRYSLNKLKTDYYNTISYNEQTGMTAADYYRILVDCCESNDKKPEDEKGLIDLKHNMCILGYNGEGGYDVHPVVKEILIDKGKLTKLTDKP